MAMQADLAEEVEHAAAFRKLLGNQLLCRTVVAIYDYIVRKTANGTIAKFWEMNCRLVEN